MKNQPYSKVNWSSEKEKREAEVKAAKLGMTMSNYLRYRANQPISQEEYMKHRDW